MQPAMQVALNTFFGQVVVINLKTRPDRRKEMRQQLRRIGLHFDAPRVQLFEAEKPQLTAGFESVGAHGCFMSHLTVLRQAMDQGVQSLLIVEDDLNFCDRFSEQFQTVANFLATRPWGILYASYVAHGLPAQPIAPCVQVNPQQPIGTSAFVAINGHHIAALVAFLEDMRQRPAGDPRGGPMHVDGAYCWFRRAHPEVVTWLTTPALGFQRSSKTDVHSLQWFDRVLPSAWLVAHLRRIRNRLK